MVHYKTRDQILKDGRPVGLNQRRMPPGVKRFADELARIMREKSVTAAELARLLEYAGSSTIGHILACRIRFPVDKADEFADALGLVDAERERFIDNAHLAVTSQRILDLLQDRQMMRLSTHPETYEPHEQPPSTETAP